MGAGQPGQPGQPGQAGESGRGGAGGVGGRGGDPSGTGGQGGPGGQGGETREQNTQRLGLGNRTRTRWAVIVWTMLVMAGMLGGGYTLARKTADNQTTGKALCALRDDVARRMESSKNYLAAHPNGAPGIPAQTIRKGISDQKRTLAALHILKCPGS